MINIAPSITGALEASSELSAIAGNRMYFLSSPADIQMPFCAYDYEVSSQDSDKDYIREDSIALSVYAFAESPSVMLEMAEAIREALDGLEDERVAECYMQSCSFETQGNVYGCSLVFDVTTT